MVFKIFGMLAADFVAQHIVWLLPIGVIALAIFAPSAALAVFRFLTGTTAGQILSAIIIASLCAWFARGYLDGMSERTRAVIAERQAAKDAEAKQAQAEAALAELRRQVEAANRLVVEARARDLANEAALESYQQKESEYEAALAKRPALGDALSDDDVRSLRAAAGAYRVGAGAPARRARAFRPAGSYP